MDLWLFWTIAGFVLVIIELATGTFYLLVLGLGAFAAAIVAWAGGNMLVQAVAGGLVALAGAVLVHHWHEAQRKNDDGKSNFLDRGQAVVLDGWANEGAGIARVKYRGALWDARLVSDPAARPSPGSTLYIEGQEGPVLLVRQQPQ
jgi:membrane protein implicated in regulation of membrane protease activity